MTSIKFLFRPSTRQGHHAGSLCVRLIHDRRTKTVTLKGFRLYPEEWDAVGQRVVYPGDAPLRTEYLGSLEAKLRDGMEMLTRHIAELEKQGRYSVDDLVALYRECRDESKLSGFAGRLATAMEKRGQRRTAKAYRTVVRGLIKFNKGKDIPLNRINACLIKDFEQHLKDSGKLPNTVSYYMRNLRAVFNKAVKEKRIPKPEECPFASVYKGVTKTMKRALTLEELQRIHRLDFAKLLEEKQPDTPEYAALENLRDAERYFEFCFYARGMSFIDMAHLCTDNIRGGFIRYVRRKTGQQMEVKLTPEMQEIIAEFSDRTKGSPYLFPLIRQDDARPRHVQYETALRMQNYRLKRLAKLSGIDKQVSTHWSRHTWASIGKRQDLPVGVISECLGHTSERTTRIYLDQLDNSLLDEANRMVIAALARTPRATTGARL